MKKIITLLSIIFCLNAKAQYVTIPDANFASYLQSIIPTAMSGNQMDTTNSAVTTLHKIIVYGKGISDLTGVKYFSSLTWLDCGSNYLTTIPQLPNTLDSLFCGYNPLTTLPTLPSSLKSLGCFNTNLTTLPTLPNSLTYLRCSISALTNLPTLPNSLTFLDCQQNQLTSLPTLPNSLVTLTCNYNHLVNLPPLPNSVYYFNCDINQLTNIPALPNTLNSFICSGNQLTSLPSLPNSLTYLNCSFNQLISLPPLPNSLTYLNCVKDSLTSLPLLPDSLKSLYCNNNKISCFPVFPNLPSHYNSSTHFWVYNFNMSNNPFTCLPNYIDAMGSDTITYPLCAAGNSNGCNVATGIKQIDDFNNQISFYPNPTSDQFFIDANTTDKLNVDVYDVNGRHVFNKIVNDKSNINVSNLNEGVYTLSIKTTNYVINKKLVIVR